MADFKKYVVKCEIHVEVEQFASSAALAERTVREGLQKLLLPHPLEIDTLSFHDLKIKED